VPRPRSQSKIHARRETSRPVGTLRGASITTAAGFALVALLLGCSPAADAPSEAKTEAASESLIGEDADTPGARFTVVVKGGDHAGTYQLESFDPQPCQIGMTGVNMFSVNARGKPPSLIYAETFIHEFQAGGGKTEAFTFGAKTAGFDIRVERLPVAFKPGGSGTATYTDDGANGIEIRIVGESKDGVPFEATVDCDRVGR
jgi:hypothetical protein